MTEGSAAATEAMPPTPKVDPETLALRARPGRAIRFKRGVIVAAAAIGSVGVAATTWIALKPAALHLAQQSDDQTQAAKAPTEMLNELPTSYGAVPKLGAPLPGDLGRPILDHQHAVADEPAPEAAQRADQAAEADHERRIAEIRAARQSPLLVQSGNNNSAGASPSENSGTGASVKEATERASIDPGRDPNAQQRKLDFVADRDSGGDTNPHLLVPPASANLLSAGSVIAASLITGLRSDLPGLVTAQVTERVFDSATGHILLIPQGARLIGSYDSVVAFGQRRALIVWQRIIMPDGSSIELDNVPATDPSGYAGLADTVDFHTWSLLKGVALSTLLGVGTSLTFTGESDLVQAIRESTEQNVSRAGDQITTHNLQVQPTITIRPGTPVRLVVHRDLILAPWHD